MSTLSSHNYNNNNSVINRVLCNKTLLKYIVSRNTVILQNIDSYRTRYHHWSDLETIIKFSHYGLIGYRLRLNHHISICNNGIRSLCLHLKDYDIFKMFYTQHQSLFLDHELLFLAIQCGSLDIVKLLSCQTHPIRFSRTRKTNNSNVIIGSASGRSASTETILQYAWRLGALDIYFYLLHTENPDLLFTPTIYKSMVEELLGQSNASLVRMVMSKGSQEMINSLIQNAHTAYQEVLRTGDVQLILQLLPNHKINLDSLYTFFNAVPKEKDGCKIDLDQQLSMLLHASTHFRVELNSSDLSINDEILDKLQQKLRDYKFTAQLQQELANVNGSLDIFKKHINVLEIYKLYVQLSHGDIKDIRQDLILNIIEVIKMNMYLAVPLVIDMSSSSAILVDFSKHCSVDLFKFAHQYFKDRHKSGVVSQSTINLLFKYQYENLSVKNNDLRMLECLYDLFVAPNPTITVASPWHTYKSPLFSPAQLTLFTKINVHLPVSLFPASSYIADVATIKAIEAIPKLASNYDWKVMCQYAARNGYYLVVEYLLKNKRESCNDCLFPALFGHHLNIVNLLLSNKYLPSFQDWMMTGNIGDCDLFELIRPHIKPDELENFDLVNIRIGSVLGYLSYVQYICETYGRELTRNEHIGNLNHPSLITYYQPSTIQNQKILMKAIELSIMCANNDTFLCLYQSLDNEQKKQIREQICPSMTIKLVDKNRILIISLLQELGVKFQLNDQLFNNRNFKDNPTLQTLLYLSKFNVTSDNTTTTTTTTSTPTSPTTTSTAPSFLEKSLIRSFFSINVNK